MKKISLFFLCYACVVGFVSAQETTPKPSKAWKVFLKNNYVNHTEIGGMFGKSYSIDVNSYYNVPIKASANLLVQSFNGVKVYKNWAVGLTVGVDWFSSYQIVPISLGIRKPLGQPKNPKAVVPFFGMDAGYGFTWLGETSDGKELTGGLNVSPQVGLLIPTGGNAKFTLSVGYKNSRMQSNLVSGTEPYISTEHYDFNFNRFLVKLGVAF